MNFRLVKNLFSIAVLLFSFQTYALAVTYKESIKEIAYWNKHFSQVADKVHKSAKNYYEKNQVFAKQGISETNNDYLIRIMQEYPQVKKHEYDNLLNEYRKMFKTYGQDIELPEAKILFPYYDNNKQAFMINVTFSDSISEYFEIKMSQAEGESLKKAWDSCEKKAYAAYGFKAAPSLYKITIINKEKNISIEEMLKDFELIQCHSTYNIVIPVKNRTKFFIEQVGSQEVIFSPFENTQELSPFHLFCAGASSNLMTNRLAGRSGYNNEISGYKLLKFDFTDSDSSTTYTTIRGIPKQILQYCTKLSPEGRVILQELPEGVYFYDFESGKELGKIMSREPEKIHAPLNYIFDPYALKIYTIGTFQAEIYDITTKQNSNFMGVTETLGGRADNSNQRMAYWGGFSRDIHIMTFKTGKIATITIPEDNHSTSYSRNTEVDFSPDDRLMAVLTDTSTKGDNQLYIYDLKNNKLLRSIHTNNVIHICFAKDGQNVICTLGDWIKVVHLGIQPAELR
jgi:WD40 repeat protein